MELKYPFIIIAAAVIVIFFLVFFFTGKGKKKKYTEGVRIADDFYFGSDGLYRKKMKLYRTLSVLLAFILCAAIVFSAILLARPIKKKKITDVKYCRDIMLCLDVSSSVDNLNKRLVDKLKDMVKNLNGERFGIIIFNTSPVLISPLTDDYEYIIEQLDMIETCLDRRNSGDFSIDDFYYYEYLQSGTLVDNEERGSSLIGDGLASCVFHFSEDEKERPKIVILSTDNDVYGQELITLPEAAKLCAKRDIVVYGIGTREMSKINLQEMKQSVEKTDGQFFLEEESGTFSKIVEKIEEKSEGLVKVSTHTVETNYPGIPFVMLTVSLLALFALGKALKMRG